MNRILAAAVAFVALPARAEAPMTYLRSFGPAADPVTQLGWGLLTVSVLVVAILAALLLGAILRKRPQAARDAAGWPPVRRDSGGLNWIYLGVGLSIIVLFGCALWMFTTLAAVARPPIEPKLTLEVTGHQWWWEVRYRSADVARTFTVANEIHIPVGAPVRIRLASADVIHSFWVPQLAGKIDAIPGQTNTTWLQADKAGVYRGQCTGYCGLQHAHMALEVSADAPADFEAWWDSQLKDATTVASQGQQVFVARCGVCHAVRGSGALGILGPDLTHLMSRRTLAAGTLANKPGNLAGWIADAQAVKPGCLMPSLTLSGPELTAVVGYLETLH